jgi:hypothetical protein
VVVKLVGLDNIFPIVNWMTIWSDSTTFSKLSSGGQVGRTRQHFPNCQVADKLVGLDNTFQIVKWCEISDFELWSSCELLVNLVTEVLNLNKPYFDFYYMHLKMWIGISFGDRFNSTFVTAQIGQTSIATR